MNYLGNTDLVGALRELAINKSRSIAGVVARDALEHAEVEVNPFLKMDKEQVSMLVGLKNRGSSWGYDAVLSDGFGDEYDNDDQEEEAREALNNEIAGFFDDLSQGGCASGFIGHLVYYGSDTDDSDRTDGTHEFFDAHYREIQDLMSDYEDQTGESLVIQYDMKNFLAWFSYEEVAQQVSSEIGIEL